MITLRHLVKSDKAIASITADECKLISKAIHILELLCRSWFCRLFIPKEIKEDVFRLKMIAAVLGRTPNEREPSLNEKIRLSMHQGKE